MNIYGGGEQCFPTGDSVMLVENSQLLGDARATMEAVARHAGLDPTRWEGGKVFGFVDGNVTGNRESAIDQSAQHDGAMRRLDAFLEPHTSAWLG